MKTLTLTTALAAALFFTAQAKAADATEELSHCPASVIRDYFRNDAQQVIRADLTQSLARQMQELQTQIEMRSAMKLALAQISTPSAARKSMSGAR